MDAIKAVSLTKRFDGASAVANLSFSVEEGELFGIVGPDGAGKTTTLRLLAAILEPTSGDAWVSGFHIVKEDERVKENIGYMSQRFDLYPDLTVMENLRFYADVFRLPKSVRDERINRLFAFSNLEPFKKRLAGKLSGGMKQKLGLSCSLIHSPKILLLDEPTNGVDPVSRRDFWRILYQLQKERVTIVISTSYLDEAERCNRLVLLHRGDVVGAGSPGEVKKLVEEEIVEIHTSDSRAAADALRRDLPSGRIELFGERVHLFSSAYDESAVAARSVLQENNIRIIAMRKVEPSLEDVLVTVIAQKEASAK